MTDRIRTHRWGGVRARRSRTHEEGYDFASTRGWSNSKRKEVKTMTYEKPEVIVLGDSAKLIQGGKIHKNESGLAVQQSPEDQLED
jgi:hypothetical protein